MGAGSGALVVVYADADLLGLNKPSGLLSVPGRGEDKQDCLVLAPKLSSAQLSSAQLSSAQLSSAQLSSAQLSSVQFSDRTSSGCATP